ncbi:hypothetical protein [Ezakiella coagulans]|uniref:hypothetical protein n=1 Tax=Ezakiella coagulans TaxID=46507 RepID=UPI0020148BF0|nr:hypothetical protein [Ezakiella coagulans]UQK60695.1 hypothetical protein M1R54_09335 [Ezakiella coagulans]
MIIILVLALVLATSCKKDKPIEDTGFKDKKESAADDSKDVEDEEDEKTDNKKSAKAKPKKDLNYVKGGDVGSVSSYVEDREIWKGFSDDRHIAIAKRINRGVHLPRILLDSADADEANAEIDKMAEDLMGMYEKYKDEPENFEIGFYASFSTYQDEDLLSIKVSIYDYLGEEVQYYRAFNFSLPDGNFIGDGDLMKHFGVDEDEILTMVEDALMEECELTNGTYYGNVEDYAFIYNSSNHVGRILNDLWDNFDSLDRQIYIDQAGRPQFILTQYQIVNTIPCPLTLELKANTFAKDPISTVYLRMARRLGIDPYDDRYKAFIIYLGAAYNEPSLEEVLKKLQPWSAIFMDYYDPPMLISMYSDDGEIPFINGQECYLIVPKYRNASVSLKELEIVDDGGMVKLAEVENNYMDETACAGPTFICQNTSEIAPNAKITIRYRDDVLEFTPSISQKDGNPVLPDEVINAEGLLDWDSLIHEHGYSVDMYEIINSLIPKD